MDIRTGTGWCRTGSSGPRQGHMAAVNSVMNFAVRNVLGTS